MLDDAMTAPSANAARPRVRGAAGLLHDILHDLAEERGVPLNGDRDQNLKAADKDATPDNGPYATLGDVMDRLDERAFGLLMLLLALPCCLPFVYILPQIVALPMLALAAQMAAGRRHPWLPRSLRERKFSVPALQKVVTRSEKYLGFVERFARPRFTPATGHLGARFVGAIMLIPTASILVPLPSTNTLPGIGVAVTSLGLIERDGFLVVLGLLIGFVWVALLMFLGLEAASLIVNWLSGGA